MTLDQFVEENTGKVLSDPMGLYPNECVSLWKTYFVDNKGVPYEDMYVPNGAAKYIWYSTTPAMLKWWDKIPVDQTPQKGDTVIYDGQYGDVALYIDNGQVFGQLGTPVFQPAAVRGVNGPIGYLRFKGDEGEDMTKDQATQLSLYMRLAAGATVDEANANSDYDVSHILADPGYAAALAKQIYEGNETFRYKASHYDADVAAAGGTPKVTVNGKDYVPKS